MQNVGLGECVENHVSPESEGQGGGGGLAGKEPGDPKKTKKRKLDMCQPVNLVYASIWYPL